VKVSNCGNRLPRKIWILWYQGYDAAPLIVRNCIDSWKSKNPNWEVILLDKDNIGDFIALNIQDKKKEHLTLALQSDYVRLALLEKFGGVWADATLYCVRALDEWIDSYAVSGFFAFANPGKDRLVASWFMASALGNPIVSNTYCQLCDYWNNNNFKPLNKFHNRIKSAVDELLRHSRKTTKFWFNPVISKGLKIYPYFALHYMIDKVITSLPEAKKVWDETLKYDAEPAHFIQRVGMNARINDRIIQNLNEINTPVFKLNWRFDEHEYGSDSLLKYLFENNEKVGQVKE
jgi:hypothetical protein